MPQGSPLGLLSFLLLIDDLTVDCLTNTGRLFHARGEGVEQSASTDQGRLVAIVFSVADKGPCVSAVVQLTSDYCTIV